ncbi:Pre-rRNA-processing protein ESF2 [Cytospora mali]|uniref:18S rRNA factor 2 n=1 Tax=Cytospora mali TaxID=578113 RepID=A0A194US97_CYTMA|nr:Pre-rRNA-processing protein ESF2 [Valsa mali var. pyri (nom. inval.)]
MAPEKRNHFLDAEDSEDDAVQDNSDDELQKGGRTAKRRKIEDESDFDEDDDATDAGASDEEDAEEETAKAAKGGKPAKPDSAKSTDEPAKSKKKEDQPADIRLIKSLTRKNLVATEAAIKKSGVVYLSRIPPFMKPQKLRSLLETYGKINRIFLAPQDPLAHQRRVRAGGNRKKMYTEGWVEFVKKKDAKAVCDLLNAQTIGGKKGTYYRDDLWSLKYLKGFKWHHLTDQIAAESAERSSRMMAEIMREKRDNKDFVQKVEKAKVLDGMQSKRAKKKNLEEDGGSEDRPAAVEAISSERPRKFKQKSLAPKKEDTSQPEKAKTALSKIF